MKKLTLQSIKFFLTVLATVFVLYGNAQTVTSKADGNWNDANTWDVGVPNPGDDVIINHAVILNVNVDEDNAVATITINYTADSGPSGSFNIGSHTISTTGDFILAADDVLGTVTINQGVMNVGNVSEDGLIINGGKFTFNDATINVSGYFALNAGDLAVIGTSAILNVSTAGVRSDSHYNFYINEVANITLNTIFTLNVRNGNTVTDEIYVKAATLIEEDAGTSVLNANMFNDDNDGGPFNFVADLPLHNLTSDIGAGNTLYLKSVTQYDTVFIIKDLKLNTGSAYIENEQTIICLNSFDNQQSENITVDGFLIVPGTLTSSSNIVGNGTVYAGTYAVGTYTVFGNVVISQDNGHYFSASTWYGSEGDGDWFNAANWQSNAVPTPSTDVTIWSGAQTFPTIDKGGAHAKNLIIDAGTSLKIDSIGDLTSTTGLQMINNSGTLTIDGGTFTFTGGVQAINNASSTINIDNDGQMTVTLDQSATARKMDNLHIITLNNNSTLTITGSLEMGSSSSLDVQGGSSVEIKQ